MQKMDAIVIGAGQAGIPLAKRLATAGYRTALIEKRMVGGTCINDGCTPTKTLVGHALVAQVVRTSAQWGIYTGGELRIDYKAIHEHKNKIVSSFRGSAERGIADTEGLTLVAGEAVFTASKTITVRLQAGGTATYTAPLIFINAGCSPSIPDIPGLADVPYYTSTSLLDLEELPAHLLIIGGSYIALELGQLYHRLGSRVTVVETSPGLVSHEDEDVAACIEDFLKEEGLNILTGARVTQVATDEQKQIRLSVTVEQEQRVLTGSHLLLATGRKPQSGALQLTTTGVYTDEKGYIRVNDYLETNVKGIYALGDIKGGPAFTHVAYNDYVIILKNLLEQQQLTIKDRVVPYCMFTDPQLGRVGLSGKQAKEKGIPVLTYVLPMNRVARALETGHTKGMMKAIVHKDTGLILGAAVIGEQGGEVMTVLQMAIQAGLTCDAIRWGMFAHPLYAESLNNLFMQEGK
jgi:pyruvate/2-oxoglutarate dehydrogenase complex dihydrolipoamide dehydrogenase (E3) component